MQRYCRCLMAAGLLVVALAVRAIDLRHSTIVYDAKAHTVIGKVAHLLADDIGRVSGQTPEVSKKILTDASQVIVCTVDSKWAKDVDCSSIRGGWERFLIRTQGNRIYVIGSDARGAAYGALHISERIGVSPWYWWADVPVQANASLVANYEEDFTSNEPSVKYRGLFINDEDWGLKPWSSLTYEPELGDIGPKTYARVCELILRLKGNMLAPAMHSCTGAFYTHPRSQEVADSFGIMITTSHCEPLLVNNASKAEWDTAVDGEWNYKTNGKTVLARMDKRIKETKRFNNIYTTGMRGLHDEGLRGNYPMKERVEILENVIRDERNILTKYKKKSAEQIPQIFVPYKEALDIYDNGLRVPDDITLVWPDDNYGYLKRISSPAEKNRAGRSGIYYHLSYLGAPHDYLWVCTVGPAIMYEELEKAYRTGADRYWLINAGDIKPMELGLQTFFDMAYDLPSFSYQNANRHQVDYLCRIFGEQHRIDFQQILDTQYRLAWDRKPEYMGYEREWDNRTMERLHDTNYSFRTGSAQQRMHQYVALASLSEELLHRLPTKMQPAYFEMVDFAVQAAAQINLKFLYAQLNHESGSPVAGRYAQEAHDSIQALVARYNNLLDGKWRHMMDVPKGFRAQYQLMPSLGKQASTSEAQDSLITRNVPLFGEAPMPAHFRRIEGIGTGWEVLQLGDPFDEEQDPLSASSPRYTLTLGKQDAEMLRLRISVVPLWPLYQGGTNRFGVSVDGSQPQVCENIFKEYSVEWKDQVLINSKQFVLEFPIDKSLASHTLNFIIGAPGQMIQKVEILPQK